MDIVPSIYILDGKCVSLYKGDLEQKKTYSNNPLNYAKKFQNEGAKKLLIVDLDKSRYGKDTNREIIREIISETDLEIILTGGIRELDLIQEYFDMGVSEIVLGVSAEPIYKEAIQKFGSDKIIVGIKAKGDEVITDKVLEFPLRAIDFAEKLSSYGVKTVLFKDIWKEGTEIHPNYDEVDRIVNLTDLEVYSSAGVGKLNHLKTLKDIGVKCAIISKSLLDRDLSYQDCVDFIAS